MCQSVTCHGCCQGLQQWSGKHLLEKLDRSIWAFISWLSWRRLADGRSSSSGVGLILETFFYSEVALLLSRAEQLSVSLAGGRDPDDLTASECCIIHESTGRPPREESTEEEQQKTTWLFTGRLHSAHCVCLLLLFCYVSYKPEERIAQRSETTLVFI